MSITTGLLHKGLRGQLGKEVVFKKYGKQTVVTKYPDMSKVVATAPQKDRRQVFARAVAYAKLVNNHPVLKAQYQQIVKKGKTVYQFALQVYLRGPEVCEQRLKEMGIQFENGTI